MYRREKHSFYLWVLEKATRSTSWTFNSWKCQESEGKGVLSRETYHQMCQHVKVPSVLRKRRLVWEGEKQDGTKTIWLFCWANLLSMSVSFHPNFFLPLGPSITIWLSAVSLYLSLSLLLLPFSSPLLPVKFQSHTMLPDLERTNNLESIQYHKTFLQEAWRPQEFKFTAKGQMRVAGKKRGFTSQTDTISYKLHESPSPHLWNRWCNHHIQLLEGLDAII